MSSYSIDFRCYELVNLQDVKAVGLAVSDKTKNEGNCGLVFFGAQEKCTVGSNLEWISRNISLISFSCIEYKSDNMNRNSLKCHFIFLLVLVLDLFYQVSSARKQICCWLPTTF